MRKILLSATLLAGVSVPAFAQTVGVNAAVVNDVRMTTEANRTLHKAAVRERVSLGNDILTGKASRLQVLLLDRTNFTVGPNAKIKVDRFVYDPNRKASAVGVNVAKGAFRFMSGKPTKANPGQSGIRTPIASIGIRGTIVEGAVGPDAIRIARAQAGLDVSGADPQLATLVLLRGPGAAAQGGETPGAVDVEAGGRSIALTAPGMAVFIGGPGREPSAPFGISDWGSAYLSWLLGTGPFGVGTASGTDPAGDPFRVGEPGSPLDGFFFDEICRVGAVVPPVQSPGNPNQQPGGPAAAPTPCL